MLLFLYYSVINSSKNGVMMSGILSGKKKPNTVLKNVYQASKKAIVFIGIFSCVINLLMLAVPIYMLQLFDRVIPSFSYDTLIYITLITIIALIVLGFLDTARSHILTRISHWFDQMVSPVAIEKIPEQIIEGNTDVLARIRDCRQLKNFLVNPAILTIFDAPWAPIFIIVIFLLHPLLGVISIFSTLILFSIGLYNDLSTRKVHLETQEKIQKTEEHISATLRNAETIHAMGLMSNIMERWFMANEIGLRSQSIVNERSGTSRAVIKSLRLILQLVILGAGAYLVLEQSITVGAMVAASILMSRALAPIEQAVGAWRTMQDTRQALKRLKAFFEQSSIISEQIKLPVPTGKLSVERVTVLHPKVKLCILNDITFKLNPGDLLTIYGPAAAGKTTLGRAILGIIKPYAGCVRLDDADVLNWQREDFGRHVGYLPQSVELFNGTLNENIARLGQHDSEKVIAAAQMAGVHEMILHLPNAYDTYITAHNRALSGGQLQRIALARAVYDEPKLLILDEPNTNLDDAGMQALIECLNKAKQKKITTILITHSTNFMKLADKILILQNGHSIIFDERDIALEKIKALAATNQPAIQSSKQSSK